LTLPWVFHLCPENFAAILSKLGKNLLQCFKTR
jgi:hypothetical protein